MKLYEINAELQEIYDQMNYETLINGCISEETAKKAKILISARKDKFESIFGMIKNNRALIEAMKNERKSFDDRIKSTEKSTDWLQVYAQREMENGGLNEYKSTKHQAKMKMNPPKISIENVEKLITWLKTNKKQKFLKFKAPEIDKQISKRSYQKR